MRERLYLFIIFISHLPFIIEFKMMYIAVPKYLLSKPSPDQDLLNLFGMYLPMMPWNLQIWLKEGNRNRNQEGPYQLCSTKFQVYETKPNVEISV